MHSEELRQYKINAFLALLSTKQSDTERCFLKDMDGSQPPWAQQILAIPSVFLLWTPCTDLVIIPSKGSLWDYRKWLQPHRELSSSLSENIISPVTRLTWACRASQRLLQMKKAKLLAVTLSVAVEQRCCLTLLPKHRGISGQSHRVFGKCPAACLTLRCCPQLSTHTSYEQHLEKPDSVHWLSTEPHELRLISE